MAEKPPLKPKNSHQGAYGVVHHTSPSVASSADMDCASVGKVIVKRKLSFGRNRSSSTSVTRTAKTARKYLKLMMHSTILASVMVLIGLKVSILNFLFYELVVIMAMFDLYYFAVLLYSNHLHWYQHKLTSIPGIFSMAVPINSKDRENTHRFIGSISELSSYPGSTPHYVLSTTSTFTFIIAMVFGVVVLDERYHYDYEAYPLQIASLYLIGIGAFGFLLAGHWSVFESVISTHIHTAGFFCIWICTTVAIFIQQNAHWLCIIGLVLCCIVFGVYGYIRQKYVLFEFNEMESAHKYSVIEILNECIVVFVIEAQCLVFIWTIIHELDT